MDTIEYFAGLRAVLSRDAFMTHVPGPGVLIRLDDRGGKDEPTPWAFRQATKTIRSPFADAGELDAEQMRHVLSEVTEVSGSKTNSSVFTSAPADEVTNTMARPAQALPVPDARGAAHVYIISGDHQNVRLGRDPTAQISIQEMSISKSHAQFNWNGQTTLKVTDMGSSNGTKVNQRHLKGNQAQKVECGDHVFCGDIHFVYLDRESFYTHLPEFMD
jgi:hypothetical protein